MTTLLTTVEVLETATTLPATSVFGSAGKVIVAGWPSAIFVASASAKPDDDLELAERVDGDEAEELDEAPPDAAAAGAGRAARADELLAAARGALLTVEPLPLTVPPTEPFTAVTTPAIGAVRVVSASAFWSATTVASSWATAALSCAIVGAEGVSLAAIVASVWARLSLRRS